MKKAKKKVTAKKVIKKVIAKKSKPSVKKGTKTKAKAQNHKTGPQVVFLGLGSNVGDREEYIEQAVFLIGRIKGVEIMKRSSNYETEPEGNADQPRFINCVIQITTSLNPYKLLEELQTIENALGREREIEWGPRTIDIDILIFGDQIISDDKLQIPHPLLHERLFVLQPFKEIAPRVMHPMLEKTILAMYDERKSELGADKYDDELPGFKEIKKGSVDDYERW